MSDAPAKVMVVASQAAVRSCGMGSVRGSGLRRALRRARRADLEDVTDGGPFARFVILGPVVPGRRVSGAPFFVFSGGRDAHLGLVPELVVAFPVADVSGLDAEAFGDRADEVDADPLAGEGVPEVALGPLAADVAGEPGHAVAALADQLLDQRPVRLAHRLGRDAVL